MAKASQPEGTKARCSKLTYQKVLEGNHRQREKGEDIPGERRRHTGKSLVPFTTPFTLHPINLAERATPLCLCPIQPFQNFSLMFSPRFPNPYLQGCCKDHSPFCLDLASGKPITFPTRKNVFVDKRRYLNAFPDVPSTQEEERCQQGACIISCLASHSSSLQKQSIRLQKPPIDPATGSKS